MSDEIKHECGVALLRLRKDLNYYLRKYGTPYYGYHKLSLLLEKQHNRGQEGAGMACVKQTAICRLPICLNGSGHRLNAGWNMPERSARFPR